MLLFNKLLFLVGGEDDLSYPLLEIGKSLIWLQVDSLQLKGNLEKSKL